jgi:dihydroorotate dehydrogenase (NAD+) catalytic subunit
MSLCTELAGIDLATPVIAAAGCAGTGRELARNADLRDFAAVVTRSITGEPQAGLAPPRLAETPSGLVNALGLPGPGIEEFLERELPWLLRAGATVIVSIAAATAADFGRIAQRLRQAEGITAVEVNLSNPIVAEGTRSFAMDASAAAGVIHAVRRNTAAAVPVFAKLAGDCTDVVAVARACAAGGADGVSLINAVRGMGIDVATGRPALGTAIGGLSGPAIKPIALRAVWEVYAALPDLPIIASGGVQTGVDALEMIMAGARAVAVGTALLTDPASGARIRDELAALVAADGRHVGELVGCAHVEEDL